MIFPDNLLTGVKHPQLLPWTTQSKN